MNQSEEHEQVSAVSYAMAASLLSWSSEDTEQFYPIPSISLSAGPSSVELGASL